MVKRDYIKHNLSDLPPLEFFGRISSIPIFDNGIKTVENCYMRFKYSNVLFNWACDTAEQTLAVSFECVRPALSFFSQPIKNVDNLVCKSLDLVEQRVPSVYLPPEIILWNTKEYMQDTLVRPVLKRVNSVKNIGNAVLDSRMSNYAADQLDSALDVADKYVDKYLPSHITSTDATTKDDKIKCDDTDASKEPESNELHAFRTMHKGQDFSRKLKRRLTERTFAEARALRKQSADAIHVLFYASELILTDPKLAMIKLNELWQYLSNDEPENQKRPETLEELLVLITREMARKIVHFINYTKNTITLVPRSITTSLRVTLHYFMYRVAALRRTLNVTNLKTKTSEELVAIVKRCNFIYDEVENQTTNLLERLAIYLSGRLEDEKIEIQQQPRQHFILNNNPITHADN